MNLHRDFFIKKTNQSISFMTKNVAHVLINETLINVFLYYID